MPRGQPEHREPTPLFLPDTDRQSETPVPFIQGRVLPPVPLFNDAADQETDDALMEFSQALSYVGDHELDQRMMTR